MVSDKTFYNIYTVQDNHCPLDKGTSHVGELETNQVKSATACHIYKTYIPYGLLHSLVDI